MAGGQQLIQVGEAMGRGGCLGNGWQRDNKDIPLYRDSPYDAVPNIIGLNGSPLDIVKSIIASPLLFAGPEWSPHTMPYQASPRSSPSQAGAPPPLSLSLLGSAP